MLFRKKNTKSNKIVMTLQIGMMILALLMVIKTIQNFRNQGTKILGPFFSGDSSGAGRGSLVWHWCNVSQPNFEALQASLNVNEIDAQNVCRVEVIPASEPRTDCTMEVLKANGAVSGRAVLSAAADGTCFRWQEFYFFSPLLKDRLASAGLVWKEP